MMKTGMQKVYKVSKWGGGNKGECTSELGNKTIKKKRIDRNN